MEPDIIAQFTNFLGIGSLLATLITAILAIAALRHQKSTDNDKEIVEAFRQVVRRQSEDFIRISKDYENIAIENRGAIHLLSIAMTKLDNDLQELSKVHNRAQDTLREEHFEIRRELNHFRKD